MALLFGGQLCAASSAEQSAAELAATRGYVYVYFPKDIGTIEVRPVDGGPNRKLAPRTDEGGKAYGAWLTPGDYRISKWNSYDWGDYPTFKVEAGRVTDLGSLVPVNIGGYELVVLPVRDAEDAHAIDGALQQYASALTSLDPIRWNPPSPPKPIDLQLKVTPGLGLIPSLVMAHDRKVNKPSTVAALKNATSNEEFLRLARSIARPMYSHPAEDGQGNIYFGADLGQIRVRHEDGTWSGLSVDTLHSVSGVAFVEGSLYAGSDNGVLRSSDDSGKHWSDIRTFGDDQAIIDIEHEGNAWIVATAHQVLQPSGVVAADQIVVYVSPQGGLEKLEKSREFPLEKQMPGSWGGAMGQLVHGAYFINTHKGLYRYDLAGQQWKTISPPTNVSTHHVDPATGTVSVLLNKGALSKVFVSEDKGGSWKEMKRPPFVTADVQFDNPGMGYAIRAEPGAFKVTWEIYTYSRGAPDWAKQVDAPFQCIPMRASASMPIICILSDGSILSQREQDWYVEFSAQ
ncbi:hypothetical protein DyAD56_20255 [Dyella sp. AD56]|uniref:hypothetical protein n=1 Tax=Dyella sp. AD56 TaxID=1528744 RepID=UPI000C854DBE|nr:hypothetical protein [Dyella sp. AD56]PMQ03057.1 hypothetical protein DyAD56_20255 [Dyella sp. AD56]